MEPDSIGKRLKELREKRGLSIRALSKLAKVPQSTLSLVESGRREGAGLSLETAKKICWALGVGIGELAGIYGEDPEEMFATDEALVSA